MKKTLAALSLLALTASPAMALTPSPSCDGVTVTNQTDQTKTYRIQLGDAAMDITLEPGQSDSRFSDNPSARSWAIWDADGALLASGDITCPPEPQVREEGAPDIPVYTERVDPPEAFGEATQEAVEEPESTEAPETFVRFFGLVAAR
jgi:hypothetical protein